MASQKQYGIKMATRLQELEDLELERDASPGQQRLRHEGNYENKAERRNQNKGHPTTSTSLTNQTIQMLNLQSSTERI